MRIFCVAFLLTVVAAVGAGFYFGAFTMTTESTETSWAVSLVVHKDFLITAQARASDEPINQGDPSKTALEARGKIAAVRPEIGELQVSENFRNWKFRVDNQTQILLNENPSKLADLRGGDEVSVTFTKQGQVLNASLVLCTRRAVEAEDR